MVVKLESIKIRNFKKITESTIVFSGKDTSVYGDNATGKTTIYDAFSWLLYGKNSLGTSDFEIKPLGAVRPEVEVEAVIAVDGRFITLKKIMREKWITKRGYAQEEFSGHESIYYINGVEKKLKEYTEFLSGIASEDVFKRLTNSAFTIGMRKDDLRKLLISMAGDLTEDQVIEKQPELSDLMSYVADKGISVEDALKLSKQNLGLYNAENDNLSVRMDEASRSIQDPPEGGWERLEAGLEKGREYIRQIDLKLSSGHTGALEAKKLAGEIAELESKIRNYRMQMLDDANEKNRQLQQTEENLKSHIRKLSIAKSEQTENRDILNRQIGKLTEELTGLANDYKRIFADRKAWSDAVYEPISEGTCDKCGQMLPAEQITAINNRQADKFSIDKSKAIQDLTKLIEEITAEGKAKKATKTEKENQLQLIESELKRIEQELKLANDALAETTEELKKSPLADDIDLSKDVTYQEMVGLLNTKQKLLVEPEDDTEKLMEQKKKVESQMEAIRKLLTGKDDAEKAKARIAVLVERGKELSALISTEKRMRDLCESYLRLKSTMLEESINNLFTYVRFRLFEKQINGGIADDCTPMINGIPYKDASNSERIRAGMDIVRALQKHEQVILPLFVDNAEAATWLLPMDCQTIRLVVSEQDKSLRFVTDHKEASLSANERKDGESIESKADDQLDLFAQL